MGMESWKGEQADGQGGAVLLWEGDEGEGRKLMTYMKEEKGREIREKKKGRGDERYERRGGKTHGRERKSSGMKGREVKGEKRERRGDDEQGRTEREKG